MARYDSIIIVTGGQVGLGYAAARTIAAERASSRIVISSRSSGEEAAQNINKETGRSNVEHQRLDLADLSDIQRFAKHIISCNLPVSALVLNAGIQQVDLSYTPSGLETTFGVNHVGHALLFFLLRPHFTDGARVAITSSGTHDPKQKTGVPVPAYDTAELLAHPDEAGKKQPGQRRYSTSKLCNVLWTYELDRRRFGKDMTFTVNAFDPGLMPGTGLVREQGAVVRFLWHHVLPRMLPLLRLLISANIHTPDESGRALARLAISEEVEGVSGKYFEADKEIQSSEDSYDRAKQLDMWAWTTQFIGKAQGQPELAAAFE